MLGRDRNQDSVQVQARPGLLGAGVLYQQQFSVPWSLNRQNLNASTKPGEHNTQQMPVVTQVQTQLPPQVRSPQTMRLMSSYTFLPVGAQNRTTFGSY